MNCYFCGVPGRHSDASDIPPGISAVGESWYFVFLIVTATSFFS